MQDRHFDLPVFAEEWLMAVVLDGVLVNKEVSDVFGEEVLYPIYREIP